jgi:hypothetical protein
MDRHLFSTGTDKRLTKRSHFQALFCFVLLGLSAAVWIMMAASSGNAQNALFFNGKDSTDSFMDFFNVLKYISTWDPYHYIAYNGLAEKAYPPFSYMILIPFSLISDALRQDPFLMRGTQMGMMSLFLFIGISSLLFALLLYRYGEGSGFVKTSVLLALFSSGIFIFSLERANTVILAAAFLTAFLFWYQSDSRVLRELSYIALACSAGLKVFPAVFGILLLKEKRWFGSLRTVLYGLLVFFLPFLFFKGGFQNIAQMFGNMFLNSDEYMFREPYYRFGFLPYSMASGMGNERAFLVAGYILLVLSLPLCLVFKEKWKTAALLTCAVMTAPVNSSYYCGLYLFAAILLFLNAEEHPILDWIYLFLFIVVLNPVQIMVGEVSSTSILANNALLCIYLLLIAEALIATYKLLRKCFSDTGKAAPNKS